MAEKAKLEERIMTCEDKKSFVKLLTLISSVYDKRIDSDLIDMYLMLLYKYSYTTIERAIKQHMTDPRHGKYFPKPACIIDKIEPDVESHASMLFTKVVQSRRSECRIFRFDDSRVNATIHDLGGLAVIMKCHVSELKCIERKFVCRYRHYHDNPPANNDYIFYNDIYIYADRNCDVIKLLDNSRNVVKLNFYEEKLKIKAV